MKEISLAELKTILDRGLSEKEHLVDTRCPDEYSVSRLKDAENIPHTVVKEHLDSLQKYEKIYFYCTAGRRCKIACETLESAGVDPEKLVHVMGHENDWEKEGLPVVQGSGHRFSIQRQLYLIMSLIILIGLFFSLTSSLWFLLLPTFIGLGMLFSSIKGVCYGEYFLSKMPWNR